MSLRTDRPIPIIETLFPGRRVHLIGGASGAGKTTWLLQTLETWRRGEPVHGCKSNPVPFLYVSYDRDWDDFIETCERMKIDPETYRPYFHAPSAADFSLQLVNYLQKILPKQPDTKLIVIEGISNRTPGGKMNDPVIVGSWLRAIQFFCRENDITIIGVLHAAKTKEKDRYKEPRARIAGCASWAGYSSTVVIVEEQSSDTESEKRDVFILPRNARKHKFVMEMKDGILVELPKGAQAGAVPKFVAWVMETVPGEEWDVNKVKEETGLSSTRIFGELERYQKSPMKLIEKVRHGIYVSLPKD